MICVTPVMRHFHARSVVRNRDTHSIRWIFDADIAGVERFQAPRVSPLGGRRWRDWRNVNVSGLTSRPSMPPNFRYPFRTIGIDARHRSCDIVLNYVLPADRTQARA